MAFSSPVFPVPSNLVIRLMGSFLPHMALLVGLAANRVKFSRKGSGRSIPFIRLLSYFPGFGFSILLAHIATRVSRATKADFIPGVGVAVIAFNRVLHQQLPVTHFVQLLPDFLGRQGFTVVNTFE